MKRLICRVRGHQWVGSWCRRCSRWGISPESLESIKSALATFVVQADVSSPWSLSLPIEWEEVTHYGDVATRPDEGAVPPPTQRERDAT